MTPETRARYKAIADEIANMAVPYLTKIDRVISMLPCPEGVKNAAIKQVFAVIRELMTKVFEHGLEAADEVDDDDE
ncbi:MAG: hypothetical protein EXS09_22515 [Gemmataceae bacterium]|nr:hypothetical protein [Gemmataceae bacterium]